MAVQHHIPVICTMEYTKLPPEVKPTNNNISESVQMEYDCNVIMHFWNGMHALGDRATPDMYHIVNGADGPEYRPILEVNIGKNKINSFKSKLYFKFFPASSDFKRQPINDQQKLIDQVASLKKNTSKYNDKLFLE
jgi:replicative DNA helicase